MKHDMVATKAFSYANRALKPGDKFVALDDNDAFILSGLGKARRADSAIETREAKAAEPDDGESQPERQNRRYRRRDMQAAG